MDESPPITTADTTVAELSKRIAEGETPLANRQGTIILDSNNELAGIITRSDLMIALQRDPSGATPVLEASKKPSVVVTYPDETLRDAVARMLTGNMGRLPVVQRANPRKVVGYLGRADILAARLQRHEEEEHREKGSLLGSRPRPPK